MEIDRENPTYGFVAQDRVPVIEFDYDSVDVAIRGQEEDDLDENPELKAGAAVLEDLFRWMTAHNSDIHIKRELQIMVKGLAMLWRIRPDLLSDNEAHYSLREIGRRLGIPVQRFSEAVKDFEKTFGLLDTHGRLQALEESLPTERERTYHESEFEPFARYYPKPTQSNPFKGMKVGDVVFSERTRAGVEGALGNVLALYRNREFAIAPGANRIAVKRIQ